MVQGVNAMRRAHRFTLFAAAILAVAGSASAQNAISVKAGMINVADGDVYLVDAKGGEPQKVQPKASEFIDIKEGQILKTSEGRAEVLLTPGAFLRMADDSSFKMFSSRMSDVRLEALSGSLLIDVTELLEDNHISVLTKDSTVSIAKAGLYRFDVDPPRVRVYQGEAVAEFNGQKVTLKGGRELLASAGGWTQGKFDAKETDPLYRWAKRRSGYLAMANVSAARQTTAYGNGLRGGSWYYNPYFGFATYVPWLDTLRSPFGYFYYTPSTVMAVYYPPRPAPSMGGGGWAGGHSGGYAAGMPSRSASSSTYTPSAGISPSSGSMSSASAPSVGAGSAGSRGGGGGAAAGGGGGGARGGRGN